MKKKLTDEAFLKALGAKLRSIREAKGWTLEDTEEYGLKSWRHLQRVESGKNVTIITLKKIAELYNLDITDIFKDLGK